MPMTLIPRPAFTPDVLSPSDIERLNTAARTGGYLDPSWLLAVVPTLLPWEESHAHARDLHQLLRLLRRLPREIYGDSLDSGLRFAEAVGMNDSEVSALERAAVPLPHADDGLFPARWDVLLTPDGPRVMEANLGIALGGVPSDALNAAYDTLGTPGRWPDAAQQWYRALTEAGEGPGKLGFVDDDPYWEESSYDATSWVTFLTQPSAGQVTAGPLSSLTVSPALTLAKAPLMRVAELFSLTDLSASPRGASYLDAVAVGDLRPTISLWCEVFNSKACLALLHEFALSLPSGHSDRELVLRVLPRTTLLNEGLPPAQERNAHVLKPARAFGGEGVVIGSDTSDDQWRDQGHALSRHDKYAVVQERVHPIADTWPQATVDHEGVIRSMMNHPPVLGFYIVNGALVSAMTRAQGSDSAVISARSGAALATVRFTSHERVDL